MPCYMKKLPMKSKFILSFFCSLKSLAVAVWIINPLTSKKKLGSNLNGTNIWDSSYNGFLSNLPVMVISLCST